MFNRKRQARSRVRQQPAQSAPARNSDADSTGRLRPGQPKPQNLSTLWPRIGRRVGVLLLTAAIVAMLVNILSVSSHVKVEPLTANGGNSSFLRNKQEYQAVADNILANSIWNRNKITINTSQVSRQLVEQFPELSSASITLPLLSHQPVVYVQPAQAVLVMAADNGAFVIDQNGRALMPSANLPTASKLPQVVDQSGLEIQVGRQILPSDDVSFIQTVLAELSAKHVQVSSMVLPKAARELDVYIDSRPYFIKFNLATDDARQQAGTYLATVAELKRQHTVARHYIDVRVEGRAYYK